jgi:hypothetical protein
MEIAIEALMKLLPKPMTRDDILILVQKVRMNLLKITDLDNGDYNQWMKGKLEFGNIKRYQNDIREIIADFLFLRGVNMTDTELEELSEKIKDFTMNQNII